MKLFKKVMSAVLTALMVQSILTGFAVTTSAYETEVNESMVQTYVQKSNEYIVNYNGFEYAVSNNKVTITYYVRSDTTVVIPSEINGMPVTSIGAYAFSGCSSLKSVTIPDGVTSIENGAFKNCKNLTNITIPNSVKSIGYEAFESCRSLKSITIPKNVTKIDSWTFCDCINLTSVTIPNGVKSIGDYVFMFCRSLKSITIPDSVISIGDELFADCSSLTNITIPDSVTSIGEKIFYQCSTLKSVIIGKQVTSIGDKYFYGCNSLRNITIPYNVTKIGADAFVDCSNLTSITIPNTVKSIGKFALGYCNAGGGYTKMSEFKIYGYKGSVAARYANYHEFEFIDISVEITEIDLNKSAIVIGEGQQEVLTATVTPSDATNKIVRWIIFDSSIATVSDGTVTGKKVGTVTLTAITSNGKRDTCKITVQPAPTKVTLNKSALIIGIGEKFNFVSSVPNGQYANDIEYTSSNTNVLVIRKNGSITTKSTGTAIVTAKTYNGKTAKCRVTVKNAPTSISINRKNSIMGLGETFYLEGNLANDEASRVLTFSSNKPEVATVTDGGIVTAKSIGTAIVSITTYNGQKATCRVTVRNAPTSLQFNKTSITLDKGKTFYLESLFNSGEYSRGVVYNSKNKDIATISGSGVIIAKSKGTAEIVGKTYNEKTATCIVTVT